MKALCGDDMALLIKKWEGLSFYYIAFFLAAEINRLIVNIWTKLNHLSKWTDFLVCLLWIATKL